MVNVNGRDLTLYGAKMQSYPVISSSNVDVGVFQGADRSSLQMLHNRRGMRKMQCVIDFFGSNYERTLHRSEFEALFLGLEPAIMDIGDGFWYKAILSKIAETETVDELFTSVEYEFAVSRHRGGEIVAKVVPNDAMILCQSNVAKTDCVIRVLFENMERATNVLVQLNGLMFSFGEELTGDLVIDGANKVFTMGGKNVAGSLLWTDFPFLIPGENRLHMAVQGVPVSYKSAQISYTPTFL